MSNIWDQALNEALDRTTLLRASELEVNMMVQRVNELKVWTIIECLSPDGFPTLGIVRMVDVKGYDDSVLFERGGIMDDPIWHLLGRTKEPYYIRKGQ